jgi:hypothetical protein
MPLIPTHRSADHGPAGSLHRRWDRDGRIFALLAPAAAALIAFWPLALPAAPTAGEDNARLVFQKTAGPEQTRIHLVKKGESIGSILRRQGGAEPVSRALLRRLNPAISDLNRIYPGQKIVLPLPGYETSPAASPGDPRPEKPPVLYRVREGDSISRIILSELNVTPAQALPAYRLIRRLNPDLPDLVQIQTGQTLRLPPGPALAALPAASGAGTPSPAQKAPVPSPPPAARPAAPEPAPLAAVAGTPAIANDLHGIIRPVISRMGGTVTASGSYFIPLQESTQITIDCALIPVVELDDGTTVLLDYGNRLAPNLRDLIRQVWKNYAFVPATELIDGLGSLQAILRHSRHYSMARPDKPLRLSEKPEILAYPDWLIAGNRKADGTVYRQALFLLGKGEKPLPGDARTGLEKSGVVVTEILENSVAATAPAAGSSVAVADFRDLRGIALAQRLLEALGETAVRSTDVVIFDQARNGFNLSITADLLVRKGEKRFIIHAKKLPDQFIQTLRQENTEVIPVSLTAPGRMLVEEVLGGLQIPFSFGHFTFRIPDEGERPRFTASLSALRAIRAGNAVYLVDFDLPPSILPFLGGKRGGSVIRY